MCDMQIKQCECINKSFETIKACGSLEASQKQLRAGVECGGCLPYLKLMFETGETSFAVDDPRIQHLD